MPCEGPRPASAPVPASKKTHLFISVLATVCRYLEQSLRQTRAHSTGSRPAGSLACIRGPQLIHTFGDRLVHRGVDALSTNCHSPFTSWTWTERPGTSRKFAHCANFLDYSSPYSPGPPQRPIVSGHRPCYDPRNRLARRSVDPDPAPRRPSAVAREPERTTSCRARPRGPCRHGRSSLGPITRAPMPRAA